MKHKFSSMGRVAIALVLALSLCLMTGVPVSADVSTPRVTLSTAGPGADAIYTIKFIPTVELRSDGSDTITIEFPEDTDISGITDVSSDADVIVANNNRASVTVGQRLTITVGATSLAADTEISVIVGDGTSKNVTNPTTGDYSLKVYTSQEPTAVTSQSYTIWTAASNALTVGTVTLDPATAAATAAYTIPVNTGSESAALIVDSTLTFQFPDGTGVSGEIAATFDGDTASVNVSGQEVTVTIPAIQFLSVSSKDVVISGVVNPNLATGYTLKAKSNIETTWVESATYTITTGTTVAKLGFTVSPSVIAPDEVATFTVQSQDQGGNLVDTSTATVVPDTTSAGKFYEEPGCTTEITAAGKSLSSGTLTFYYKDATAGDYTITVTEKTPSDPPWTDASTPLTVSQQLEVALYHGDTLIAYYHTITEAITNAVPGDTIKVSPGTYAEGLDIDKQVTLTGVTAAGADNWTVGTAGAGATAPTIVYDGSANNFINVNEDNVTIQGFKIDASTWPYSNAGIYWTGTCDKTTIQYNTLNADNGDRLINLANEADAAVATNFLITYNAFTISSGSANWGNWFGTGENNGCNTNNVLSYNSVVGQLTCWLDLGTKNQEDITWLNNDMDYGIVLNETGDQATGKYGDIVVKGNTFAGAPSTSAFEVAASVEAADFENSLDGTDVTIVYNDFTGYAKGGNETVCIVNAGSADINAEYNYWGTALNGPYNATTNPNGTDGDVSDNVDYSPWSHKLYADMVADNAEYPVLVTDLSVGWNTLSTPAKLISTADSVGDLVPDGMALAYWYDAFDVAKDGVWELAATHVLNPCDAVYIKMNSAQRVLFLIDGGITWVPSKDLAAGWNMIGLASLTDMEDDEAIASVYGSYSQLVSPSMNTGSWVYVTEAEGSSTQPVKVGEGYWIFMTSSATLGGFTLCPIVPQY